MSERLYSTDGMIWTGEAERSNEKSVSVALLTIWPWSRPVLSGKWQVASVDSGLLVCDTVSLV